MNTCSLFFVIIFHMHITHHIFMYYYLIIYCLKKHCKRQIIIRLETVNIQLPKINKNVLKI